MAKKLFSVFFLLIFFLCQDFILSIETSAQEPDKEVRETIKMWMLYKFKTDLGLKEEQCLKVFELIDKRDHARREFHKYENQAITKLDTMLEKQVTSPESYLEIIEQIQKKQAELYELDKTTQHQIGKMLDPIQQAKLMVLTKKLKRKIRDIIHSLEKRDRNRRNRHSRGGLPPDKEFPLDDEPY